MMTEGKKSVDDMFTIEKGKVFPNFLDTEC
jgi:hypothetical protein